MKSYVICITKKRSVCINFHRKNNLIVTWHLMQVSLNCEHSRKRTHRSFKLEQASLKLNPTRKQGFSGWRSLSSQPSYHVKYLDIMNSLDSARGRFQNLWGPNEIYIHCKYLQVQNYRG